MSTLLFQYVLVPMGYVFWQVYMSFLSVLLTLVFIMYIGGASVIAFLWDASLDDVRKQAQLAEVKQEAIVKLSDQTVHEPLQCAPIR